MDYGRIPPQSIIAEKNVLGSMIIDNSVIDDVIGDVTSQDFYKENNKEIFEIILEMNVKGEPVEISSLEEKLKNRNTYDQVGGYTYLIDIVESVSSVTNVKHYIELVKEKSTLRQIIKQSMDNINNCYEEEKEVSEVLQIAQLNIMNINNAQTAKNVFKLVDCLPETMRDLEKRCQNKGNITGLPTGFTDLDYKTGGLQNSDLILVAARPAMGKTSFGLNIAEFVGLRQKEPVMIFSLEMSKQQLINRILCSESMVDSHKIKIGNLDDDDFGKIAKSIGPMSEAEIYIDDSSTIKVHEMHAKSRKLKKEKGLALIIIDYIQLMSGSGKNGNREQEVAEISRSLKIMAKELNVPVIALSQLSRGPEQRQEHRPILSDLRESGAIEQDADIVMFLYRDDYYNPNTDRKNLVEVILSKHRSGGIGTVELVWLAQYTKFANLEKYRGDAWEPPIKTNQNNFKKNKKARVYEN